MDSLIRGQDSVTSRNAIRGLDHVISGQRRSEAAVCGCCDLPFCAFSYIPVGEPIAAIPLRTLFGEPRLASVGGFLFASSFAKCGVSCYVVAVVIRAQTVVSPICCGQTCNCIQHQFYSFHTATVSVRLLGQRFLIFRLMSLCLHVYCAGSFVLP